MCHLLRVRISKWGRLHFSNSAVCPYLPFSILCISYEFPIAVITNNPKQGQNPEMGFCWTQITVWAGLHSFTRLWGEICVLAFFISWRPSASLGLRPLLQFQGQQRSASNGSLQLRLWSSLPSVTYIFRPLSSPLGGTLWWTELNPIIQDSHPPQASWLCL